MSANVEAPVQRCIEEVWNKGNLAVADELVAPRMINHFSFTPELEGPEDAKRNIVILRTAFPDIQYEIDELVAAERDIVVVRGDSPWLTVDNTEEIYDRDDIDRTRLRGCSWRAALLRGRRHGASAGDAAWPPDRQRPMG